MAETHRLCPSCGETKPIEKFGITGRPRKDGSRIRRRICRKCQGQQRTPEQVQRKREQNRLQMAKLRAKRREGKPPPKPRFHEPSAEVKGIIPLSLHSRFVFWCAERGITQSAFLRQCIERALNNQQPPASDGAGSEG